MPLGRQHVDIGVVVVVRHVRIEEFRQVAIRLFEDNRLLVVDERPKLQRRLLESQRFCRPVGAHRLPDAVAQDQRRLAFQLRQEGRLSDVGDFVIRVAAVVRHEEGNLRPLHVSGESGEAVIVGHESALADERGSEVGRC